jgi:hypothetical protein
VGGMTRLRMAGVVGLALVGIVLAGCRGGRAGTPSGTPQTTFGVPLGDFSAHEDRAYRAVLPPEALGPAAHPAQASPRAESNSLVLACNAGNLPSDDHTRGGSGQSWKFDDGSIVEQFAQGYDISAADVVREVQRAVGCNNYRPQDGGRDAGKVTVVRDVPQLQFPGLDASWIFCEVSRRSRCVVLLARGDVVSRLWAAAADRPRAEELVRQAALAAADRLAAV